MSSSAKYFLLFLLAALILIGLRIQFIDEPFERDEGGYAYMSWRFLNGEVMYRDYWDTKPPGIVCIYALIFKLYGISLTSVRTMTIFFGIIALMLVYLVAEKMFDKKIAITSVFIYAFFSSQPISHTISSNAEPFMIIFTLAGIYFYLFSEKRNNALILSGALFGIAFMVKQTAVDGLLAVILYSAINKGLRIRNILKISAGIVGVWVPVIIYFLYKGVLNDFFFAAYVYNFTYINKALSYHWLERLINTIITLTKEDILLWVLAISGFFIINKRHFLRAWTVFAAIGVTAGGRFFPHYFVQLIPVLSILSGYCLNKVWESIDRQNFWAKAQNKFIFSTLSVLVVLTFINQIRYFAFLDCYDICKEKYPMQSFEFKERLAEEVKKITNPDDYIFVWGSEPEIYFFAERRSPVRFINNHYVWIHSAFAEKAKKEIMQELNLKKPKAIIIMDFMPVFPELVNFVKENYKQREILDCQIYYAK